MKEFIDVIFSYITNIITDTKLKSFHKIIFAIIIVAIVISGIIFIDRILYISSYFYNKHKLDNLEKIIMLLNNDNLTINDKEYLNEMKNYIIENNRLSNEIINFLSSVTSKFNTDYQYKNYKNYNIFIIIISHSWFVILIFAILLLGSIIQLINKKISILGFIFFMVFIMIILIPIIIGFHIITKLINIDVNIYVKNIVFSVSIIIVFIFSMFIYAKDFEKHKRK